MQLIQEKGEKKKKETKNKWIKQKTANKMVDMNSTISIITLNVNSLNTPMKEKLSYWI